MFRQILNFAAKCTLLKLSFIAIVVIGLEEREKASGVSWELLGTEGTPCKSLPNMKLKGNRFYEKHCELKKNQNYTLKCGSTGEGWKSNYLVIENSIFCKYAESDKLTTITITGEVLISGILDCPLFKSTIL